MRHNMLPLFSTTILFVALLSACAPKIYVVDRQTVLEEEAAGSWPQFEQELLKKSIAATPTAFSQIPLNKKRARLLNILNGELVSDSSSATGKQK